MSRRVTFACLMLCILGSVIVADPTSAQQATYTITGRALAVEGDAPIPGVQVAIRGTRYGGLTNADGVYSIVAQLNPGQYVVEATMIGREQQRRSITLGAARVVDVPDFELGQAVLALEEVVVTGTAAPTARRALGNAVSTVSSEQISEATATTIDQALQGKVAGATITSNTGNPGGGVSMRLRGTSSIVAGAEPLIIVDGVIIDNNADQQINFGYRSNPSNRLADLDPDDVERVEILKGAAAAALYGSRANNGVVQIFTKRGRAGINRVVAGTRMTRNDLERTIEFALTPTNLDLGLCPTCLNSGTISAPRFDPQPLLFREPWSTDTYLSVSGGSPETQYYISGNLANENGIMRGSDHRKLNVRMNIDQKVADWLNLAAGANYIRSHTDLVINGEQGSGGLLTAAVFAPTTIDLTARDPVTGEFVNRQAGVFLNPLYVLETFSSPQDINRFVGSFQARSNPFGSLRLNYTLGYDQYAMETMLSIPRGTVGTPLGSATSANRRNILLNNDLAASYDFGSQQLRFTSSAGLNHTYQRLDQLNASATDLVPQTDLVSGAVHRADQARIELVTLGFFGQQQLSFDDRLYLTGALRWDASSTFGEDERWQIYPKVSASWVASEESFVRDAVPWVSELRLRGALGYAGNQPPLSQAFARVSRFGSITNVTRLGLVPLNSPGNPELKPERQREWEAGVDFAVLNNRIGTRFTYYDQYVTDLLLVRPFVPSAGFGSILDNVGELSNRGIELELNTQNLTRGSFSWNSRVIYSRNENRIEKLNVLPFTAGYTNLVIEGQPVGVHFMPAFMRDESGQIVMDTAIDGPRLENRLGTTCPEPQFCLPNSTSRIVGNPWPDWTGSLFNEFRFGSNWSASFLLDGSFGAELWNQTRRNQDIFGAGPLFDQVLRGEATPAQRTRLQSIWENYLEDASYIKMRDITVRYSTAAPWLRAVGASRAEFELVGRNLKTWTDYGGYDPEINMFGLSTVERGTDFAVYPNARTIGFGVRLTY
ncbi:MAG: SusC/RagA family TonB-linked outer membrane protein [Gemmatimonadota bacterium]